MTKIEAIKALEDYRTTIEMTLENTIPQIDTKYNILNHLNGILSGNASYNELRDAVRYYRENRELIWSVWATQ